MSIYICIHYTHTNTHIHMYTVYTHTNTHIHTHILESIYHTHTGFRAIQIYEYEDIYMYIHKYMYIYTYRSIDGWIDREISIRVYTNTQTHLWVYIDRHRACPRKTHTRAW